MPQDGGTLKAALYKLPGATASYSNGGLPAVCMECGGRHFIICHECKGTKRGKGGESRTLKCSACNENGLLPCFVCKPVEYDKWMASIARLYAR